MTNLVEQTNLAMQAAKLEVAKKELHKAQSLLDEKQKELDAVQAVYDAAMREKQVNRFITVLWAHIQ